MPLACIGLGSNLASPAGPPEATLASALDRLASLGEVRACSSLYSTEPVGYADQPRFLNAVALLETALAPRALLDALMRIEREYGRDRSAAIPNGPRPLDLDILVLGDATVREPGLEIPHPRMTERAFVMIPLAEAASQVEPGGIPSTLAKLLKQFHERSPGEPHAVVPVQSALWHARAGRPSRDASGRPD